MRPVETNPIKDQTRISYHRYSNQALIKKRFTSQGSNLSNYATNLLNNNQNY